MKHAGAGGNDCAIADGDTRCDEYVGGNPHPFAESNRGSGQWHGLVGVIMAGSAEKAILTDSGTRAKGDPVHAVAVHVVAEATVLTHDQIPRRPDFG